MSCSGCPGKDKNTKYDARGNVVGSPSIDQRPQQKTTAQQARELTYQEYLQKRAEVRATNKVEGDKKVLEFSDDYKRIQIEELIAVYNLDEVHFKLTPMQALAALWEFSHHPAYQKVFNEFEGLREQIETKYAKLRANRLIIKWKP